MISSALDICESTPERDCQGRGSRCWLGMTLGLGTTVGFSTKGLNSRCCPPAPPAAAFLLCTAWGYSLEQEETESPTRDHISAMKAPLQPQRQWLALGHSRGLQKFHWSSFQCPALRQGAAASAFI